jgi:hypothetical protein
MTTHIHQCLTTYANRLGLDDQPHIITQAKALYNQVKTRIQVTTATLVICLVLAAKR